MPATSTEPAPRRRRLPGATRRATLLAAALDVFAERGYQATRMADVAARVGVTEPVVFQNFGSKAGLFAEVQREAAARVVGLLADARERAGDAAGALERFFDMDALDGLHAGGAGAVFLHAHGGMSDPGVADAHNQAMSRVAEAVTALVAEGQAAGAVRADVPAVALTGLLMALLPTVMHEGHVGGYDRNARRGTLRVVLGAIRPPR